MSRRKRETLLLDFKKRNAFLYFVFDSNKKTRILIKKKRVIHNV